MDRLRLMDRKQLAKELGVTMRTISTWRKNGVLPEPLVDSKNRPFWSLIQIENWQRGKLREDQDA